MNENIDLTKILKYCPIGWEFYSSVYGDVEFLGVLHDYPVQLHERDDEWSFPEIKRHEYPIKLMADIGEYFVSREGKQIYSVGECTLFPSKEQRDWNKFTAPWYKKYRFDPKTLKPFDKVLVRDRTKDIWNIGLFSHIDDDSVLSYVTTVSSYIYCIPYNDDTKQLLRKKDEAPEYYRYWED